MDLMDLPALSLPPARQMPASPPLSAKSLPELLHSLESTSSPFIAFPAQIERLVQLQDRAIVGLSSGQVALACFTPEPCVEVLQGEGHAERISCLAAVDRVCVSGSRDSTLKVWDVPGKQVKGTLVGHTAAVTCLSLKKDGSCCLSGSRDNTIRVWSLGSMKEVAVLTGHTNIITCLALTHDGQYCVSGSFDNSLRLWSLSDRRETARFLSHSYSVYCLTLTEDGGTLISGSADNAIKVWNLQSKAEVASLLGHKSYIRTLAVSRDGKRLVSGSGDCTVRVWDLREFAPVAVFAGHSAFITAVVISPDGDMCLSAASDNLVKVWSLTEMREVATLQGHSNWVTCLSLLPDRVHCVSGSADCTLRLWTLEPRSDSADFAAGEASSPLEPTPKARKKELSGGEDEVTCLGVVPPGDYFASGSSDGSLKLWSLHARCEVAKLEGHTGGITCLAASADGRRLVSGSSDTTLRLWDIAACCEIATFVGHSDRVNCVGITTNCAFCVSVSADSSLIIWSLKDLCQVSTLSGHSDWIDCLALSPNGAQCASGSRDLSVRLWSVDPPSEVAALMGHTADIYCLAYHPDGKWVVSGSADNLIKVWSIAHKREIATLRGHTDWIYSLAIAQSGQTLVSGAADHSLRLWNLRTLKPSAVLCGHTAEVSTVYVTQDDRYCVSGGYDGSVRLWSMRERREVPGMTPLSREVICAVPVLAGCWCLSGAADNTIHLQPLPIVPQASPVVSASSLFLANIPGLRLGHSVCVLISKAVLLPYTLNSLHISAYYGHWSRLQAALDAGVPILTSAFGSPLRIALEQVQAKCAEVILAFATEKTGKADSDAVWPLYEAIEEDIGSLLQFQSPLLLPFLQTLLQASAQQPLPEYLRLNSALPCGRLVSHRYIDAGKFGRTPESLGACEPVAFRISLVKSNVEPGSASSLALLRGIHECKVPNILQVPYLHEVVTQKWRACFPFTLFLTGLCLLTLGFAVALYSERRYVPYDKEVFIGLNAFFAGYELIAGGLLRFTHKSLLWTLVHFLQSGSAVLWLRFPQSFLLPALAFAFLRGLLLFRLFSCTQLHVHITLFAVLATLPYLLLSAYLLAGLCALLYVFPDANSDVLRLSDVLTAETLFTLAICVVSLGALLSAVGSGDDWAERIEEAFFRTKLSVLREYETWLLWKRGKGSKRALVLCDRNFSRARKEGGQKAKAGGKRMKRLEEKVDRLLEILSDYPVDVGL